MKIVIQIAVALAFLLMIYLVHYAWTIKRNKKVVEEHDKNIRYPNPLADGRFRNKDCPCLSGKKMKKCHGVDPFITWSQRVEYMEMVRLAMNRTAVMVNEKTKGL